MLSLEAFTVHEYASRKFVSTVKEGSELVVIEDTANDNEAVTDDWEVITEAQIVGIPQLDKYRGCLR